MAELLHEFILQSARRAPDAPALKYRDQTLTYAELAARIAAAAATFLELGLQRGERIAVYMEKRLENVAAMYGAALAGGVFVPVNPLLKAEQVAYIMQDCNVRILVTTAERLPQLQPVLALCPDLRAVLVVADTTGLPKIAGLAVRPWQDAVSGALKTHRMIDADVASILYTSGSTGRPKGVVLSHGNIVAGAYSVSQYLELTASDRLLSVLPLSFDYGLNQLSTMFLVGGCAVLINYLLPRDIVVAVERERITGLAAVPPLWIQLAQLKWPQSVTTHLRYITNSGGHMPKATLDALRAALPHTKPYLMYGLTEAFRSTYLPPEEVDRRPDSMGQAIPNAEIMVVREDGALCAPNEPGELVHRGALVSLGYWNDAEKTAERFKPVPRQEKGLMLTEIAVWSGDTVRMDEEGFLYFIGRRDEMIKTSGYRVSPTEIEEVVYATGLVAEAAAFGVTHPVLGQGIVLVATPKSGQEISAELLTLACTKELPAFMVPGAVRIQHSSLPRNPNGKIDRKSLAQQLGDVFDSVKT